MKKRYREEKKGIEGLAGYMGAFIACLLGTSIDSPSGMVAANYGCG
jgi:hypothetical protein